MINKEELIEITSSAWDFLAEIFKRRDLSGDDRLNIMFNLVGYFINVATRGFTREEKDWLIKEFIDLIEHHCGRDYR
jgi:hypothetical protein